MKITIIGTNGMISEVLSKCFFEKGEHLVNVYGLDAPVNYPFSSFIKIDLLADLKPDDEMLGSELIVYAAGAGVQAALKTSSHLMYKLNVNAPIDITLNLKMSGYKGVFVSFGSYMEIGENDESGKMFDENQVINSCLPVSNDYALSKRLFSRYMNDFRADFVNWHFILPNSFSLLDLKPGTRLIPYVLNYLTNVKRGMKVDFARFSSGVQTRQFIMLEEVIEVIERSIASNLSSGVYNIGGGEFLSIRNLIERLFAVYNVECIDDMFGKEIRRDGDIRSLLLNGNKLFQSIQYLPVSKIEDVFYDR